MDFRKSIDLANAKHGLVSSESDCRFDRLRDNKRYALELARPHSALLCVTTELKRRWYSADVRNEQTILR